MGSKDINAPKFYAVNTAFHENILVNDLTLSEPEKWRAFLKECGLEHTSFSRLQISNEEKFFLAKIRYGF